MLRIGKGIDRQAVRRAFDQRTYDSFVYEDVLEGGDIRETVAGIREAGNPQDAQPLLAWLASHPNAPEDVLRDLLRQGGREVLLGLALNPKLPEDMMRGLMAHQDEEVRLHANHVVRLKRH